MSERTLTENGRAVAELSAYFGAAFSPETCEVDTFYPGAGWVPVTRDSLFTVEGFEAAVAQGVTGFAVSVGRRDHYGRWEAKRTADFVPAELAPRSAP